MGRICISRGCRQQANFDFKESKSPSYCKWHAEDGMVNLNQRQCLYPSCTKLPRYNTKGIMPGMYCMQHAEDGMANVHGKECLYDSCTRGPGYNFNLEGSTTAMYCKEHAEDGMVCVLRRRCFYDSCLQARSHNFKGKKTVSYCQQHAEDGMVDVCSSRCSHFYCKKRPSYNFGGIKKAMYCKQHAEDGMVCVRVKRSPKDSQTVVGAARRVPTDGVPTACAGVKSEISDGAVTSVSVETLCEASGCLKLSRWGVDGKQRAHCLDHAPLADGLDLHTATAAEMARVEEEDRSSSSLGSKTHLNDSGGGGRTAPKRTRHWLYRRPLPP